MAATPPLDIPLQSDSPPSTPPSISNLWFNDGTLVLQAGGSSFRVYGGMLGAYSPIFHAMLELPQPDGADSIHGCPVVRLDDSERDLRYFLRALFDHEFFAPYPAPTHFATISGIFRLSKKYEVESLRRRALEHLSSAFPTDPAGYSSLSPSWKIEKDECHESWIRVILFAREMSLDWILPLSFYRASAMCTPSQVMKGITLDGIHLELNAADKLMCYEQSIALRTSSSTAMIDFLWEPLEIAGCQGAACKDNRFMMRKQAEGWREQAFPLTLWLRDDWKALKVCGPCMAAMKVAHKEALDTFWDKLPQRFGLPSWDELQRVKGQDLALPSPM
ncbi:hypothetical protein DFH06DRAFT_394263 [Mycena polygramma]|nr:hypothetical protein DFH06DRAFT_394263 [Mycena polygramma]